MLAVVVFRGGGGMSADNGESVPLAIWARTETLYLELYQSEIWTGYEADPDRHPVVRTAPEWAADFSAWKTRKLS